jgi:hypothetical protein
MFGIVVVTSHLEEHNSWGKERANHDQSVNDPVKTAVSNSPPEKHENAPQDLDDPPDGQKPESDFAVYAATASCFMRVLLLDKALVGMVSLLHRP